MNIYVFLKQKLKERHLRVEAFISLCNTSKSTMYRVMKGYQQPSEELEARIIDVLALSPAEQQMVRYYASLPSIDESELVCWESLVSLFTTKPNLEATQSLEMVFYSQREQFVRTFDQLLKDILKSNELDGLFCNIRMMNCCLDSVALPLARVFGHRPMGALTIEHLVRFSSGDPQGMVQTLNTLIAMAAIPGYQAYYAEKPSESHSSMFNNMMIMEFGTNEEASRFWVFYFCSGTLSGCLDVVDDNTKAFFSRCYNAVRPEYISAFQSQKDLADNEKLYIELEQNYDVLTIKPNPSYIRVPQNVYCHMIAGTPQEEQIQMMRMLRHEEFGVGELETKIEELLEFMQIRMDASFARKHVDVYTKKGLAEFAEQGVLSDGFDHFIPFTIEERREIFHCIQNRNNDPQDSFCFYILKDGEIRQDAIFVVFREFGLQIAPNQQIYQQYDFTNYIFAQKELASLFCSFIENYIPSMMALTAEEADEFIDGLIEDYC